MNCIEEGRKEKQSHQVLSILCHLLQGWKLKCGSNLSSEQVNNVKKYTHTKNVPSVLNPAPLPSLGKVLISIIVFIYAIHTCTTGSPSLINSAHTTCNLHNSRDIRVCMERTVALLKSSYRCTVATLYVNDEESSSPTCVYMHVLYINTTFLHCSMCNVIIIFNNK